ncbi:MAG: phosphoribosyltransferase family protein [Comamonadaceae bacterium]|nr:phosphoribosyltransferase family protein [Comamonadaceae bacterium]
MDYAYPWHAAIAAFKYHDAPQWARAFGALLWQTPGCQDVMADAEVIFPVPLALPRLRERGYNQAWELAKVVARHAQQSHKLCFDGLARVTTGPAQARSGKAERQSNLQAAFRVTHAVMGRHVLLVDDVMTTGATLFTLAGQLRQAGAREVSALVFARTALRA